VRGLSRAGHDPVSSSREHEHILDALRRGNGGDISAAVRFHRRQGQMRALAVLRARDTSFPV